MKKITTLCAPALLALSTFLFLPSAMSANVNSNLKNPDIYAACTADFTQGLGPENTKDLAPAYLKGYAYEVCKREVDALAQYKKYQVSSNQVDSAKSLSSLVEYETKSLKVSDMKTQMLLKSLNSNISYSQAKNTYNYLKTEFDNALNEQKDFVQTIEQSVKKSAGSDYSAMYEPNINEIKKSLEAQAQDYNLKKLEFALKDETSFNLYKATLQKFARFPGEGKEKFNSVLLTHFECSYLEVFMPSFSVDKQEGLLACSE